MTTNSYDEAFDLGDGYGAGMQSSIGTPPPGKICYICDRRILGQVAYSGSNVGFSVCADCVQNPWTATTVTPLIGQRHGDDDGAPSGIAARLDFNDDACGLPERSDGLPPGALELQCIECSCFGAVYFSQVEKNLCEAWCLECRLAESNFIVVNQKNAQGTYFETEELPDSEPES